MLSHDTFLIASLVAFVVAVALTPLVRELSLRNHWMDEPNHRSSHDEPTPRLGGIAFIVATIVGVAVGTGDLQWWMLGIGIGGVLVAVTGLLDDLKPLGPAQKFLPQVAAAVIAVVLLDPRILIELPVISVTLSSTVSAALAIIWIVAVINAFNFLDGLDGLASGVAIITALALVGMLPGTTPLLVPFAAALAGFLLWNSAPASIFMGDVGSQFVGYLLATAVLMPGPSDTGAVPVLFAFVPVLGDAAVTIARRVAAGSSPFVADRNHVFHGLAGLGLPHRAVANLYYGVTGVTALAGLAYLDASNLGKAALLGCAALVVAALSFGVIELPHAPRLHAPSFDGAANRAALRRREPAQT